jgi:hypothetical protein
MKNLIENSQKTQPSDDLGDWHTVLMQAKNADLIRTEDQTKLEQLNAQCALGDLSAKILKTEVCKLLAAGSASEKALKAIGALFLTGDVIELRAFPPINGKSESYNGRLEDDFERMKMIDFIRRHIGWSNVYFGVNPRSQQLARTSMPGRDATIAIRRAVFIDLDNKDAPEIDPKWAKTTAALASLAPAMVTHSGNGWHFFFLTEFPEANPSAHTNELRDLMKTIGADNMADPSRIARLPFTPNLPTTAKRKRGASVCLAILGDI